MSYALIKEPKTQLERLIQEMPNCHGSALWSDLAHMAFYFRLKSLFNGLCSLKNTLTNFYGPPLHEQDWCMLLSPIYIYSFLWPYSSIQEQVFCTNTQEEESDNLYFNCYTKVTQTRYCLPCMGMFTILFY
jgi:hypothetical protein